MTPSRLSASFLATVVIFGAVACAERVRDGSGNETATGGGGGVGGSDDPMFNDVPCDGVGPSYLGEPLPADLAEICDASPLEVEESSTPEAVVECLVGEWLRCPGMPGHMGRPDVVGLEFSSDGQLTFLVLDDSGHLQRGTGIDYAWVWKIDADGTMNSGTPELMVGSAQDSSGWWVARPLFTSEPQQMRTESLGRLARP